MKNKTIFGTIFSAIMFGIYAIDAYNTGTIIVNNANPAQYGFGGVLARLAAICPWWWLLCAVGAIISGLLAPILYWLDSPRAVGCASSAFGLTILQLVLRFVFRYRLNTFAWTAWIMAMSVALLTLAFAGYLHACRDKRVVSEGGGWRFLGSRR